MIAGLDPFVIAKDASWKNANGDDNENEHEQFANYRIVFEGKKRLRLANQAGARGHAQQIAEASGYDAIAPHGSNLETEISAIEHDESGGQHENGHADQKQAVIRIG